MSFSERTHRSFQHWAERAKFFTEQVNRVEAIALKTTYEDERETLRIAAVALGNEANECNVRASVLHAVLVKCERGELCSRCGINKARESECGCVR